MTFHTQGSGPRRRRQVRLAYAIGVAAIVAAMGAHAVWARPLQAIPEVNRQARALYTLSHVDMRWRQTDHRIFIAVPKAHTAGTQRSALYVLDGNAQYPLALNALQQRWASGRAGKSLPIIVGLGYPVDTAYPVEQRKRDYTYAVPGVDDGGGAEAFYQFLVQRVQPYVEEHYGVSKQSRQLSGHSFGGLFALYVLLNHGDTFSHYTIGSPSLWWGKGAIVTESWLQPGAGKPVVPSWTTLPRRTVTIVQGEYEENPAADPAITPERKQRIRNRKSPVNARQLNALLQQQGINSRFVLAAKANHGAAIVPSIEAAVDTAMALPAMQDAQARQ